MMYRERCFMIWQDLEAGTALERRFRLCPIVSKRYEKKLEVAEVKLAAQTLEEVKSPVVVYDEIMKTQQRTVDVLEALAKAKSAPPTSTSTIRVEPKVTWPRLDDGSTGPKDAEEFFKKLSSGSSMQTR